MKTQRHCAKYVFYKYAHFLLFSLLPTLWIYRFQLLFHVISTDILKFPLWFPGRHSDSSHFLNFHPDSLHSHSDSSHPHSILISCISTLILRISFILFSNSPISEFTDSLLSLQSWRIYFRKIVALVQKRTLPFATTA